MGGRGGSSKRSGGSGGASRTLTALSGSEKQISWATDIRQKVLSTLQSAIPELKKAAPSKEAADKAESMLKKYISDLKSADRAGDIIDLFGSLSFSGNTEKDFGKIISVYRRVVPTTNGQIKILGRK